MNYVDAIEEGKIVRVSEEYAKQEGLFILKKVEQSPISPQATTPSWKRKEKDENEGFYSLLLLKTMFSKSLELINPRITVFSSIIIAGESVILYFFIIKLTDSMSKFATIGISRTLSPCLYLNSKRRLLNANCLAFVSIVLVL